MSKYAKYLPPQEAEALYKYIQSLFPEEVLVVGGRSNPDNEADQNQPVSDFQQLEEAPTQQSGNIKTCNTIPSNLICLKVNCLITGRRK